MIWSPAKRLPALLAAGASVLALSLSAANARLPPSSGGVGADKPDIVIFIADDLRRDDLRVYGGPDARTPNIDQLAKDGVRFTNAFAASPSCSPSRASVYSGVFPMRHGGHANHSAIRDGIITMPSYLQKLGYRVVIAGKTHVGERGNFPFEYMQSSVTRPDGLGPLASNLDMVAIDTLLARRDKGKPLALIVNSFAPHVPWEENKGYDPQALTVPPYLIDTSATRQAIARYLTRVSQADEEFGALRASIVRHGMASKTLVMFTADQGSQFPSGKWNLYDAGIAAPLIAVWPGHIAAGASNASMISLVDILPTMQEAAGGKPAPNIDGCSFMPLLLGISRSCRQEIFAAHSGMPEIGPDTNVAPMRAIRTARYKLIVNFRPDIRYVSPVSNGRGRDRDYWNSWIDKAATNSDAARLLGRFHNRVPIEFYDLAADPYELKNLVNDPAQSRQITSLRKRLLRWMVQQGENPRKVALPSDAPRGHFAYGQ